MKQVDLFTIQLHVSAYTMAKFKLF